MANINDSIQLNNAYPLDARTKIASLAAKNTIVNPYVGLPVWVDDPGALYVVKSTYMDPNDYLTKVNVLEEVSSGTFVINVSDTEFSELVGAITSNKIIVIEDGDSKYFASVGVTNNQNEYLLSYVDSNGALNQITANSSGYTQTTKSLVNYFDFTFDSSNSANTTTPADLKDAVDEGKLIRVNGYVATKAECFNNAGTTFVNLYYYDDEGRQHHIYKNATTQLGYKEDVGGALSNAVTTEASSNTFTINNSDGDPVGTITLSTAASGAVVLTFADNNSGSFVATLPNLAYDSSNQMLKMVDAGGNESNLIKLSNLQIKEVAASTSALQLTPTLGDLVLIGDNTNGYELNVFDGTNWQPIGSINNVSLQADQIHFASNSGLESTNVRDAIDEVNIIGNSDSDADLDIADENGKVALRLSEGHLKTKNFDSRNIKISVSDDDEADLDFADDNGHVALRVSGGHIKTKNFDSANVVGKVIKVLIYGNSWAGDAVSYAGPLLDEILNGDAKVHIGFCYQRSSSLQDHYNNADNNSSYEKFFYYNSDNGWVSESSVSFNDALHLENWDIVLLQQVSGSAAIVNSYQPYLSYLIDIISSRANKPVKFGWILARDKFNQSTHEQTPIWNNAKTIAQALLNSTLIDFVVPTGTATENARTTSLDELGIHLTDDGTHLQDGVPCLVEAYCFVLSILNVYGFGNKSINGSKFIPGATIQPNGSVIGVTSGNIVLAQKCAIFAFKNPFVITDIDNLDLETEYQHLKSLETTNTENTSSSES